MATTKKVLLYLCTNGKDDDKRRWSLKTKQRFNEYDAHKTFFEEISQKNELYDNPFFADRFSAAKSYFLFRIVSQPLLSNHQADLLEDDVDGEELFKQLQDREHASPIIRIIHRSELL